MEHQKTPFVWRRLLVVSLVSVLLLALLPLLARAKPALSMEGGLHVLSSDDQGILFELRAPHYQLEQTASSGPFSRISAPSLPDRVSSPGSPDLPALSQLVAVPPGATVRISILEASPHFSALAKPIQPLPVAWPGEKGRTAGGPAGFQSKVYQQDAFFPAERVTAGEPVYFRDQRVVPLTFYPLRVNSVQGRLEHTERMLVRVDFVGGNERSAGTPLLHTPETEALFANSIVNYEQGRAWRGLLAGFRAPEPGLDLGAPAFKIEVATDGIYRVDYDDLAAAGMEVGLVDPISLSLASQGQPVAIEFLGDEDGVFEPGEGFNFYGQQFRGTVMEKKYTDVNVYWLTVHGAAGPRMPEVDGTPGVAPLAAFYLATAHFEEDHIWHAGRTMALGDQDTWFWDDAKASSSGDPVTTTHAFTLTALASANYTASVRAALFSQGHYAHPEEKHWGQVYVNDQLIDEQGQDGSWEHIDVRTFLGTIPAGDLLEGENAFDWVVLWQDPLVPRSTYPIYSNWFEIEYRRQLAAQENQLTFGGDEAGAWTYAVKDFGSGQLAVWDISSPLSPTRVLTPAVSGSGPYTVTFEATHPAGARFIAAADAAIKSPLAISEYVPPDLDPPAGADWIAISHPDFITEVQRLAGHRTDRGLRTIVVDVNHLYNQYSHGIYQPAAIHDYLARSLTWPGPAPAFAVLVGDGHWNFKRVSGYTPDAPIFIPPYLAFVDPYQGEVPVDNLYATLVGADAMPDIALGRLPVRTLTETAVLVDKLIQHDDQLLTPDGWRDNVVFLADDPDAAGAFHTQSDAVVDLLPEYLNPVKIYYGADPYTDTTATQQAVVDAFNAGAHLYNFRGHGSLQTWAGTLFLTALIPSLTNADRLPVVLTMDCLDGYFAYPGTQAISEELIRYADGGSVGHWGSSGLGITPDHSKLHEAFYEHLFENGASRFGEAVLGAKLDFLNSQINGLHNLHTFTLFGDPATHLLAAELELNKSAPAYAAAGDLLTYTLLLTNTGPADLDNLQLVDVLPGYTTFHDVWGEGIPGQNGVVVTWTLSINAGQTKRFFLQVRVDPLTQSTSLINNDYHAAALDGFVLDVAGPPVLTWAAPPPSATFEVSNLAPLLGKAVYFTSTSTVFGSPSFNWDFGDGLGTAVGPTAVHTYTGGGPFVVTLQVSDEYGIDSDQQTITPVMDNRVYLPLVIR